MGNSDFEPIFCFVKSDNFFLIAIGLFFAFCFLGAGLYLYFLERRKKALRKAFIPTCRYCGSGQMFIETIWEQTSPNDGLVGGFSGPEGLPKVRNRFYRCRNCGKESPAVF